MESKLLLFLFLLTAFISCEKSNTPEIDPFLVVGSNKASIRLLDTLISPERRCKHIDYQIDIDQDGVEDIVFYIYYCYSPAYYTAKFECRCLSDHVNILTSDTIMSPAVLNFGDTLDVNRNWTNEKLEFLHAYGASGHIGGDGRVYKYGPWYPVSNKYIGFQINKDNNPRYGWIKVSVPDQDWIHSMTIHEIGYYDP